MSKKHKLDTVELNGEFRRFVDFISGNLQELLRDDDESSSILKELEDILFKSKNALDVIKSKPRGFSLITYKMLYDYKYLNLPEDLNDLENWKLDPIYIPKRIIKRIEEELTLRTRSIGVLSVLDNEQKKKKFVDAFVDTVLVEFHGAVINDIEGYISEKKTNTEFRGSIEYIIRLKESCILVIIEAKKNIAQSENYGQIMSELYSIFNYNKNSNRPLQYIYGILTTGEIWYWWRYNGKIFEITSEDKLINKNKRSIPIIASKLMNITIQGLADAYKEIYKSNEMHEIHKKIVSCKEFEESEKILSEMVDLIKQRIDHNKQVWEADYDYMDV